MAGREDIEQIDIILGEPKPGALFASVIHVFRARAEGELRAGGDAKGAAWCTAGEVLLLNDFERLSDLDTAKHALLPWARETGKSK